MSTFSPTRFPGLTSWLLSDTGLRYFEWFVRKHFKKLLSTKFGAEFCEWVASKVLTDNRSSKPPVVILVYYDGFIKVFGQGVEVKLINVPKTSFANELVAEELVYANAGIRTRSVLYDERRILATGSVSECLTVSQLAARDEELKLIRM